jgi:2-phospho-L-lactate guanylyltransferase
LNIIAIIPVREFDSTKLRLREKLSASERGSLTKSLLTRILGQLQDSQIGSIVVVASDKKLLDGVAKRFSKAVVIQETTYHGGVNKAMEDGLNYCNLHFGGAEGFMLIPSDLPLFSSVAVNKAISSLASTDLLISPSAKRDGTSLLLFNYPRGRIPFHYDDDSYNQHVKEAKKLGINYSILRAKEFQVDVDSVEDLKELMLNMRAKSFTDLIQRLDS